MKNNNIIPFSVFVFFIVLCTIILFISTVSFNDMRYEQHASKMSVFERQRSNIMINHHLEKLRQKQNVTVNNFLYRPMEDPNRELSDHLHIFLYRNESTWSTTFNSSHDVIDDDDPGDAKLDVHDEDAYQFEIKDLWAHAMHPFMEVHLPSVYNDTVINSIKYKDVDEILEKRKSRSKTAVLVILGSSYMTYSKLEAFTTAKWLGYKGFLVFILRYRFGPNHPYPRPIADAQKALKILKFKSKSWGIEKIIVWGQNSGGHIASILSTHYNYNFVDVETVDEYKIPRNVKCKPDAQVLLFPLITMGEGATQIAKDNLLKNQSNNETLINFLSSELHVTKKTPMAFVVHTINTNNLVSSELNSDVFVDNLYNADVPVTYFKEDYGVHSTVLVYPGHMGSEFISWYEGLQWK